MLLYQHIEQVETLDLIISRNDELSPLAPPALATVFSDHFAISCHFRMDKPDFETKSVTSRKIDSIDMESFRDDLEHQQASVAENLIESAGGIFSNAVIEQCMADWERGFQRDRAAAGPPPDHTRVR